VIITSQDVSYSEPAQDASYEVLVVEEVGVLTTYFFNATNGAGVYVRNGQISQAFLVNLSRGGRICVSFQIKIALKAGKKELAHLKHRIERMLFADKIFSARVHLWIEAVDQEGGFFLLKLQLKTRQNWRPKKYDWKELRSQLILDVYKIVDDEELGLAGAEEADS